MDTVEAPSAFQKNIAVPHQGGGCESAGSWAVTVGFFFSFFASVMKDTITKSSEVLTIEKVSERDFQTTFTCTGTGAYKTTSKNITLRQRGERHLPGLLSFAAAASLMPLFPPDRRLFWPGRSKREHLAVLPACRRAAQVLLHRHRSFGPSLLVADKPQNR